MTQEQIHATLEKWNSFSAEEKANAKAELLDGISKIDNLGEISPESLKKIVGGLAGIGGRILAGMISNG